MDKIDFSGGCHGNFLEVMLDMFVYGNNTMKGKQLFNSAGAAHEKVNTDGYVPLITTGHYSAENVPFNDDDRVIEIHCCEEYRLAALTNYLLRAGDQTVDIINLHQNTIFKLKAVPKAYLDLQDLIDEHGIQENYDKQILRNHFYSKFEYDNYGISMWNTFKHTGQKYVFPLSAFYNLEAFYYHLNKCAYFLNLNFYPTRETANIWHNFITRNQGYQSQKKCNKIIQSVLENVELSTENLTLVEEAYIAHRLAKLFRCYDHPLLTDETFPTNTIQIADAIYTWKSKDYATKTK
ncbi:hypothetical protein OAP74_01780 [bacterium]|nr:hypothetical protein [bacterium]